jgi:hypothetical protein
VEWRKIVFRSQAQDRLAQMPQECNYNQVDALVGYRRYDRTWRVLMNLIRKTASGLAIVAFSFSLVGTKAEAESILYDVRNEWYGAVETTLSSNELLVDTMDGGADNTSDYGSIALPSGIATVNATGGDADSAEDLSFANRQVMRVSDDGTSAQIVTGENVLRLGLSSFTTANTYAGDFRIAPSSYVFSFSDPVSAFSFDYSGAGFSFTPSSLGVYAVVDGIEVNLSYAAPYTAGFFGVISTDPISSFEIRWTGVSNYTGMTFDNFAVVMAAVPLPPSIAFFLFSLLSLVIASSRRRRSLS